jgi:dolichol-phosphate mannosyltransferase/undecaprenyl-phosphate 4-deoxy-4-formamido-L-arabinose transferase
MTEAGAPDTIRPAPALPMKYSVVIPVYNSVGSLPELASRLGAVFDGMAAEYEIIMVDDGSANPETWRTLERLAGENPRVLAIRLSRNFGQQPATLCGIAESSGDHVITMDDDLQHSPEDIPRLAEMGQHDVVIAQFSGKKHSLGKRIASRLKGLFDTLLIGKPAHIRLSPFRMINRATVDGMLSIRSPDPFIPALMFYVTKDVVGVPIAHQPRAEGRSNYTLIKMLKVFNNLIIGNSSFLLRIIGYFGVTIASLSMFYAIWILLQQLLTPTFVPGWTSVIVSVLFVGGLLLFSVGIIGEYLIRIISGVESRPSYVVRQKING